MTWLLLYIGGNGALHTVQMEILSEILFGGFAKNEAKLIFTVFNLVVAEGTWSLFIDNALPINQNHACVLAAWEDTMHISKHFWTPTIGETFVHKRYLRTLQILTLLQWWRILLLSVTYWGRSPKHAHNFCAEMEALLMWTMQLMDYILEDFNLAICSKTANLPILIPRQYFRLYNRQLPSQRIHVHVHVAFRACCLFSDCLNWLSN